MRLTPLRIAVVFALEAAAIGLLVLGQIDLRLHRRDPAFAVNQWGFRGDARAQKGPGEIRIAVVGGSAAFEAGTPVEATFAANMFFELQTAGAPLNQGYSVVNLAAPRVGADTYPNTLRRYRFLDADILCIFDGYDVASGLPPHARERSAVFSVTGYLPLLPARLLGRPAWLSDPDGGVAEMLQDGGGGADVTCSGASRAYCATMAATVRAALDEHQRPTVVVSPPAVSRRHVLQQRSLARTLQEAFAHDPRFRYLDLTMEVDLKQRMNSLDGVRRTLTGNHEVAQRTAVALLKWFAAGWGRPNHRPA